MGNSMTGRGWWGVRERDELGALECQTIWTVVLDPITHVANPINQARNKQEQRGDAGLVIWTSLIGFVPDKEILHKIVNHEEFIGKVVGFFYFLVQGQRQGISLHWNVIE